MTTELLGRKILVTGGAGFIGSNICEKLIESGCFVVCVDNFITGRKENIEHLLQNENFKLIEGDIVNFDTCQDAMKGCDYICHQAALGSIPRSIDDPIKTNQINVDGTLNIFVAALNEGIKRIVFASSSSVYGDEKTLPKQEDKTGKPLSPYAITKSVNEMYANVFSQIHDIEIIGLRYFNVFGRRQDPEGMYAAVIPKFVESLINKESPKIFGDGEQTRDFTYIDNVVDINIKALLTKNTNCYGEVFNVAFGENTSINQLYYDIRDIVSKYDSEIANIEPIYLNSRTGDIKHSHADISKAVSQLNYSPQYDCKMGLNKAIQWYWNNLS